MKLAAELNTLNMMATNSQLASPSAPPAGLDAMQSDPIDQPAIKQEEYVPSGVVDAGVPMKPSPEIVESTTAAMASNAAEALLNEQGQVVPVPPPNEGEAGSELPWTDTGYLPRHVGAPKVEEEAGNGKTKPRRKRRPENKAAAKARRAKAKRRGILPKRKKNLAKGMNVKELNKFRSAEYTRTDQQMRTEARLKRLQEIYAHEVSGAPLDDTMKKEKLKLIELENNRRAAKVSRAKKRQYIRDLEQRVEMFSK